MIESTNDKVAILRYVKKCTTPNNCHGFHLASVRTSGKRKKLSTLATLNLFKLLAMFHSCSAASSPVWNIPVALPWPPIPTNEAKWNKRRCGLWHSTGVHSWMYLFFFLMLLPRSFYPGLFSSVREWRESPISISHGCFFQFCFFSLIENQVKVSTISKAFSGEKRLLLGFVPYTRRPMYNGSWGVWVHGVSPWVGSHCLWYIVYASGAKKKINQCFSLLNWFSFFEGSKVGSTAFLDANYLHCLFNWI